MTDQIESQANYRADTKKSKPGPDPTKKKTGTKIVEGPVVGRDRIVVPPEEVFKLAAIGCKDHEIADWFGIKNDTLRYNFTAQLVKGRESMKQSLRRKQLEVAYTGNAVMLIWLGKNLLGQTDSGTDASNSEPLPWND